MNGTLTSRNALVLVATLACLVAMSVEAAVVTSNNLASQNLGSLTATTQQVYTTFSVAPDRLQAVQSTVRSLVTGSDCGIYAIDGISRYSNPTNTPVNQLLVSNTSGDSARR